MHGLAFMADNVYMTAKKMAKIEKFSVLILISISVLAAVCPGSVDRQLRSSLVAESFYEAGYDLYTDPAAGIVESRQAMILFLAAAQLDDRADYLWGEIINLAWKYPDENYSDVVYASLVKYVVRDADLEIASRGLSYLLERLDSREQRQELLEKLIRAFEGKNKRFVSDLWMRLGFLYAETGEAQSAQGMLMNAYSNDKYNRLTFAKLEELSSLGGEGLGDYMYLQSLRDSVTVNPLDFQSAYSFGQYADALGLFPPAAAAYKYCVQLDRYLSETGNGDVGLYRMWMLSSYNAEQYRDCYNILGRVRKEFGFDVASEAICSAAALRGGDQDKLTGLLGGLERRSKKILDGKIVAAAIDYEDFAWFFAFLADSNSQDMLTWATKAYDVDPNSTGAGALFAYALAVNGQMDLAESVLDKVGDNSQIGAFARARILDADGNTPGAIDVLKSAIGAGPGTFEAAKAIGFLEILGDEYAYFIEPKVFVTALKSSYGSKFFSDFMRPEEMISMKFSTRGSVFSYGTDINAELAIINNSSEPLVVSEDSIFTGGIRIDAKISGDIKMDIPELIVRTVRPSKDIKPGDAMFVNFDLAVGEIKKSIHNCYPQANLNIEFTIYLDPIVDAGGNVKSAIGKSGRVAIKRQKLNLSTKYLQQRLDALKRGHQGQKIKSAQLFAGLLCEQQEMRKSGKALYKFKYAEPQLLSSAIVRCLSEDDWVLKCESILTGRMFRPDYRLVEAISGELDNDNWPVRLAAVFVMGNSGDEKFAKVLDWASKYDTDQMVKDMALLLLAGDK